MVTPNVQQQMAQVTVYILKGPDGFQVKVRVGDGSSSPQAIVDNLVQVFGMACQNCGMQVKMQEAGAKSG